MSGPSPQQRGVPRLAVLGLSAHEAEWLEYAPEGEIRYGRVDVSGITPADLVSAALAARGAAGGRRRGCVLALGDGVVQHELHKLPPLPRKDLERVLLRKAAAASRLDPEHTLFSGYRLTHRGGDSCHWLTASMERRGALEVALRLRRHRLGVRRVTTLSTAILDRAETLVGDSSSAAIVVVVGPRAVEASLIGEGALVSSEVLEGDFLEAAHLVSSLLQSVRTLAAFWRRSKRGVEVGHLCLFGLPNDRGRLLAQTLSAALPGAVVHLEPGPELEGAAAGRIALLAACLEEGSLAVELTPPMPWRQRTVAAASALLVVATVGGYGLAHRAVDDRCAMLEVDAAHLERCEPELLELQRESECAERALAGVRCELDRARAIWSEDDLYERTLAALAVAFEGRATLLSLTLSRDLGNGRELQVSGLTIAEPVRSTAIVGEIEETLLREPGFADVRIDLPSRVGGPAAGERLAPFTLHAKLEVGP